MSHSIIELARMFNTDRLHNVKGADVYSSVSACAIAACRYLTYSPLLAGLIFMLIPTLSGIVTSCCRCRVANGEWGLRFWAI